MPLKLMLFKSDRISILALLSVMTASVGLPAMTTPAVAEVPLDKIRSAISESEDGGIAWGQGSAVPEEVWAIMQSQTSDLGSYGDILKGTLSNGNAPGSIPPEVWSVMQSQSGLPESYSGIFDGLEQIVSRSNSPYDFSNVVSRDNWGISAFSDQPFVPGSLGDGTATSQAGSAILQAGRGLFESIGGKSQIPDTSGFNPFKRTFEWLKKTPIARTLGTLGNRIRGTLTGSGFGLFTKSPVVKQRDQANLFDQEIARMMAEQYLGETGEQRLAGEAQDTLNVLQSGLQSANAAMQIANASKGLTSTQDVAKAVAQQGGQNAALSAAVLQMQAQNQASLQQLQQLTSSVIQLSANNSEGIDEANRRERAERSNALGQSASEFIYVPHVFD